MTVRLLAEHHLDFLSLKGGCTGSSESTLVKMPHCWKSHVTAHLYSCTRVVVCVLCLFLAVPGLNVIGSLHVEMLVLIRVAKTRTILCYCVVMQYLPSFLVCKPR